MISEKRCKYPKTKKVSKLLLNPNESDNEKAWKEFDCVLKYPSKYGDSGIDCLKKAQKKEKFYVSFSDTEDFQGKMSIKKLKKKHPISQVTQQTNLNHLVPMHVKIKKERVVGNQSSEHVKNYVESEIETFEACESIIENNETTIEFQNVPFSQFHEIPQETESSSHDQVPELKLFQVIILTQF
ncbi:unnamed protein product [Chironomus riparius]|uniref:Uncharacterized protein n=1 Tax=Chironomus riparius TaxID=315576 RepID=A0A9N9WNV9_9DIPT|nr:unnamed protein product [Chironomus riparius]CAG9799237.1 unnamed protein product [Chironomus riparius]